MVLVYLMVLIFHLLCKQRLMKNQIKIKFKRFQKKIKNNLKIKWNSLQIK